MLKVRSFVQEGTKNGKMVGVAEISVASSSELATSNGNYIFTEGSIAWDISTGDFYGLEGGTWHKQNDTSGDA